MRGSRVLGSQPISLRHFHNIQMGAARVKQRRETRGPGNRDIRRGGGRRGGGPGEPDGDRGCESGVVCRGMVLPADIFIGGHATCNRARGIRTERCFAHLYPRSGDSPVCLPSPRAPPKAFLLLLGFGAGRYTRGVIRPVRSTEG